MKVQSLNSRRLWVAFIIPASLVMMGSPGYAQLALGVSPSSAPPGGSGSFDVTLTDVAGSFHVAGFTFDIAVAPSSGVAFTGADMNTVNPYIFLGNSLDTAFSIPFTTSSFPTTEVNGGDTAFSGFTALSAGDVLGLGDISYSVAPGTSPGPVTITFEGVGSLTSLSDESGNNVAFTTTGSSIDVISPSSSTPEPGAYALLVSLGLAGAGCLRRRRNART